MKIQPLQVLAANTVGQINSNQFHQSKFGEKHYSFHLSGLICKLMERNKQFGAKTTWRLKIPSPDKKKLINITFINGTKKWEPPSPPTSYLTVAYKSSVAKWVLIKHIKHDLNLQSLNPPQTQPLLDWNKKCPQNIYILVFFLSRKGGGWGGRSKVSMAGKRVKSKWASSMEEAWNNS